MKTPIVLIGAGGHQRVVRQVINDLNIYDIVAAIEKGEEQRLPGLIERGVRYAFIGVGQIKASNLRAQLFRDVKRLGFTLPVLIHPSSYVCPDVSIGEGSLIAPGVVINTGTKIGANVVINTRASIDHDCVIEDHVFISPGVTLCGEVNLAEGAFVGAGSTSIQAIKIGRGVTIGAGSVVLRDVPSEKVVFGIVK